MKYKDNIDSFNFSCEPEGSKVIIKEYSANRKNVMLICERVDGTFTYGLYFWDLSDYEHIGYGYWALDNEGGIYSELKSAIKEAKLEFRLKS